MSLKEGEDFVLVKTASQQLPGFVMESGNLIVTKNYVILNVIQEIDPKKMGGGGAHSIKEAIQDIKDATKDLKQNIKDLKSYAHGVELVHYAAARAENADAFAEEVAAMGASNPHSLKIKRSDVKEFKIGFFKGFQVHLNDGKVVKIRTGSLGALKKITA